MCINWLSTGGGQKKTYPKVTDFCEKTRIFRKFFDTDIDSMNWFDFVIAVPLVWAIWRGFNHGLVQQLLAIVALIGGVWAAWTWGGAVGEALGLDSAWAATGGFVALFAAVLLALAIIGRFTKGLFRIVGLGALDTALGVFFSMAKVWLIASVVVHWMGGWSLTRGMDEKLAAESMLYTPLLTTADIVFPYIQQLDADEPTTEPAETPQQN